MAFRNKQFSSRVQHRYNIYVKNYVTVKIGSNSIDTLVDTGAVHSLINEQTANELKLKIVPKIESTMKPLLSANGSKVETTGHVMAELYFKGLKVEHRMEVAKSLSPSFILRMDFLVSNQAGINYALKPPMFTLYDGLIELPFFTRCYENNCVTLARTVCIPVNTPTHYNNQEVLLEPPPRALSVSIARALAFCKNNKAVCRILNTNPYVVTLKKGMQLAKIAGLIDTVASMCVCQPPLTNSVMTNSAMRPCQTPLNNSVRRNKVTEVGMAKSQVTNRGMANNARPVKRLVMT